jgi:hypothetical protein
MTLARSIVSGNYQANGALFRSEIFSTPPMITNGFNLLGHRALTTAEALIGVSLRPTDITATSDGTRPTLITSILEITPAYHGGLTNTQALPPGSPAIDGVTSTTESCDATDERGISRPQDGDGNGTRRCDIGAFERQSVTVP